LPKQPKRGGVTTPIRNPLESLEAYFRDVAAHDLLTSEDELRLAREIETGDVLCWEQILSYAPLTDHLLGVVEASLDNSLSSFRELRKAAASARKLRDARSARELTRRAREVGTALRGLDLDRTFRDAVTAEIRRIAAGDPRPGLRVSPHGKPFTDWLRRIGAADRTVDALRTEFINANLRLVVTVARKYRLGGLPLEDLIQEGNLGLMKAVDRFDYRRGLRFSTYATWWIRHCVGRALAEKSRTIRLPVHMIDSRQRIAKVRRELTAQLKRDPTTEEVATAAALPAERVEAIEQTLPERRISFDQPVGEEGDDRTRLDIYRDDDQITAFDVMAGDQTRHLVGSLLGKLKPIERDVLRQRFGFTDGDERTLQQIAEQYGLSRERIRQIQEEACRKLRRIIAEPDPGEPRSGSPKDDSGSGSAFG
jgi:RNA polymerase primary sigma factor